MTIIYIAYSCSPYNGTEDKLGWYIPYYASRNNDVIIITKEEQRKSIERYRENNDCDRISVIYIDIPAVYKKIYKGGLYSGRQNVWNERAYREVRQICKTRQIDIIHQVNPVEFRSIGKYGSIEGVPFVCGPVGGGEYIPYQLKKYIKTGFILETIRMIANAYYKTKYRVDGRIARCSILLFANKETRNYLISNKEWEKYPVMTELGSLKCNDTISQKKKVFTILSGGRLIYRKGFDLLYDAIELVPERYEFRVMFVGDGPLYEHLKERVSLSTILKKRVIILGRIPHEEMEQAYQNADIFFMPSLRETTGSVVLESLENGVPVVTMNRYGASIIVNDECGILYDLDDKIEPADKIAKIIIECIDNQDKVKAMKPFCKKRAEELSFANKIQVYESLYRDLVTKKSSVDLKCI